MLTLNNKIKGLEKAPFFYYNNSILGIGGNMKKLDILIPQYKEDESVVCGLLNSIEMQRGIDKKDIQIIIVNDGTDVILSDEFLGKYNFDIKYLKNEKNMGISYTRNRAFDNGDAEYVMFCDDDDMFFSALGLYTIFMYMKKEFFDVLVPWFKEETIAENGETTYINHKKDITFNHGKVYRRSYLEENEIRFSTKVTFHEDVYFNALALTGSPNILEVNNCYYLWCNNMNSTTRRNKDFLVDNCDIQVNCYYELVREFLKRGLIENARINVASGLFKMYYESQTEKYEKRPDRLYVMEKCIKKFYNDYKKIYNTVSENEKIDILKNMKRDYLDCGVIFEKYTFSDWLKHIEELE